MGSTNKNINSAAFSLVEMAVIVLVIGIFMSVSFGVFKILVSTKDEIEIKARVDAVVSSLVNWASTRGRLPNSSEFSLAADYPDNISYKVADNLTKLAFAQLNEICKADNADTDDGIAFSVTSGDITRQISLNELKSKLECRKKGENSARISIVTALLPVAYIGGNYLGEIKASGGDASKYKWCMEPLIINSGKKDEFIKQMKFYTKDKLFSDDCSSFNGWDKAPSIVIRMEDYGWKGLSIGAVTIRVYVTDSDIKNAVFRDFSFVTAGTPYIETGK